MTDYPSHKPRTDSEEALHRLNCAADVLVEARNKRDRLNNEIKELVVAFDLARRAAHVYGHTPAGKEEDHGTT